MLVAPQFPARGLVPRERPAVFGSSARAAVRHRCLEPHRAVARRTKTTRRLCPCRASQLLVRIARARQGSWAPADRARMRSPRHPRRPRHTQAPGPAVLPPPPVQPTTAAPAQPPRARRTALAAVCVRSPHEVRRERSHAPPLPAPGPVGEVLSRADSRLRTCAS